MITEKCIDSLHFPGIMYNTDSTSLGACYNIWELLDLGEIIQWFGNITCIQERSRHLSLTINIVRKLTYLGFSTYTKDSG